MISKLQPYPEYKESGLPWLGRVPQGWDVQRTKWLFRHQKEINSDRRHTNILSLTLRGVVNNNPDDPEGLVPKDYGTYQFFGKGDLVFKLIDLENLRTSRVGLVHEDGIMSSAYVRLIPNSPASVRFFFLQFYDLYSRGVYNQLGAGVRSTLGPSDLLNLPICLPPPDEQAAIVRFLDYANGGVERAIRSKRKVIALLHEQKQAIIHRAVTRGLDPTVPFKPSGIPWLGDIPKHWEVRRTKYVFREVDNRSVAGSETHLAMSQKLGLVPSDMVQSTLRSESYAGGKLCETGDLVLNRLKAHLGVFAVAKQQGVISPDYSVFRKLGNDTHTEYFESILRSSACRRELRIRAKGIVEGFWRLYTDDFYDIRLPVPPVPEQRQIMASIDGQTVEQNTAIARLEREIALLREYRTRLVADVVTGKLDVREAATKLPDLPAESAPEAVTEEAPDELETEMEEN